MRSVPPPCSDSDRFCCSSSSFSRMDMRKMYGSKWKGDRITCPLIPFTAVGLRGQLLHVLFRRGARRRRRWDAGVRGESGRGEDGSVMGGIHLHDFQVGGLTFVAWIPRLPD